MKFMDRKALVEFGRGFREQLMLSFNGKKGDVLGFTQDDVLQPISIHPSIQPAYINQESQSFAADWLSFFIGGEAFEPRFNTLYLVLSEGEFFETLYYWTGTEYRQLSSAETAFLTEKEISNLVKDAFNN